MALFANADFPDYLLSSNQVANSENLDLYHAASKGDVKNVLLSLANGGKPNFFNVSEEQKTSLHIAAENGHSDVVKILLEKGAVIDCMIAATKVRNRNRKWLSCSLSQYQFLINNNNDDNNNSNHNIFAF